MNIINNKNLNYWKDIYTYKDLFLYLSLRDFQLKYRQTFIGILWSVFRPLLSMLILTFVFSLVAGFKSDSLPYPLLVLSGLLIWQQFSSVVNDSSNSLVSNASLITKVYFPRIIIPISTSIVCFLDFLIGFIIYMIIGIFFDLNFSIYILLAPLIVIFLTLFAMSIGIFLSALNVKYRDVKYVISFLLQLGLYASPVAYETSFIPAEWKYYFILNPIVGYIDLFRWSLSGGVYSLIPESLYVSLIATIVTLFGSLVYFKRSESQFSDNI